MAELDPIVTDVHGAMEAHRQFLVYMVGEIERQRAARGGEAVGKSDAANEAIKAERRFVEYLLCSIEARSKEIIRVLEEVRSDRFLVAAALIALSKQKYCNHAKLQADIVEAAEALYGAADKVPAHLLDVSKMIEAQGPRKEN